MSQPPVVSLPNSPGWSRWIERLRAATQGRFTILRELGRGGFAAVFLAQQHQPSRRVAIKLLLPAHLESEWALEHFRGESQKIAQWRHQSVVTIYEVHEEADLFYFVMSYVEGASLHEILHATGPLPVPVAQSILAQMGSALWYAHRQGVTHRDIKPQNVLIDTDGGAVVADFGIAKQAGGTSHTVTGMIFGTAPYMAPEQCETGATSTQSDQYALGIVAYEMLTGSPPFTGPATAVLVAHLQKEVPLLRTVRPDCPPELEAAVARMLSKKPEDRFATIAEAVHAAGAAELPEFNPNRQWLAQHAKALAAQHAAHELDITTIPPQIEVGERIPMHAKLRTNDGERVDPTGVNWRVENNQVADVDSKENTLQAREPGFTTLFVRSGGLEKQVQVEVVPPRAHTIVVDGMPQALSTGQQVQLAAHVVSKHGLQVSAPVTFVSDDPAIALVGNDGVLQARTPGRTRIRATADQVQTEWVIDVTPRAVSDVRIVGIDNILSVGERRQAMAVVLGAEGETLGDRAVSWRTTDPNVATVSAAGIVTAHAVGSVTLAATCDGVNAQVTLEVQQARAASVEILNGPGVARVGDSVALRAVVRDAMGRTLDKTAEWLSDEPEVASVTENGTITALSAGSAIISANVDGVSAATLLDVAARGSSATVVTQVRTAATMAPAPGATEILRSALAPSDGADGSAGGRDVQHVSAQHVSAQHVSAQHGVAGGAAAGSAATGRHDAVRDPLTEPAKAKRSIMPLAAAAVVIVVAAGGGYALMSGNTAGDGGISGNTTAVTPATPAANDGAAAPGAPVDASSPAANPSDAAANMADAGRKLAIVDAPRSAVSVGDAVQLGAQRDGRATRTASWTSSNPAVATVTREGVVRGIREGRVYIRARDGALVDSIAVNISGTAVASTATPQPGAGQGTTSGAGAAAANNTASNTAANTPPATTAKAETTAVAPPSADTRPANAPASDAGASDAALQANARQAVANYASALQSRQISNVTKVFPSMPGPMRDGWNGMFRSVRDLQVNMRLAGPVTLDGARGTGRVNGEYVYVNPSNRKQCRQEVTLRMTFDRLDSANPIITGATQESSKVSDC